jgi:hypothetical protein
MQKNNTTVEEIRTKQGLPELQSDPHRRQELQQTQSVMCGINPRTHILNLTIKTKTTIDDPQVSNGITPWNLHRIQEQTRQLHAQFVIRIACDLRGLNNNPFSADHREIAAKSSLSAEIISSKSFLSQTNKSADHEHRNETLKNE